LIQVHNVAGALCYVLKNKDVNKCVLKFSKKKNLYNYAINIFKNYINFNQFHKNGLTCVEPFKKKFRSILVHFNFQKNNLKIHYCDHCEKKKLYTWLQYKAWYQNK
jgi:hypothetical protein